MSLTETQPETTTIDGPKPVQDYRELSSLAMVALVLGLISPVAVFSPILGIFALVAIAVGGYALWHIHANSDRLSGRWMAIAPLILAPLFLGWGCSREFSRRERFFTHAREFGDEYLSILNRNEPHYAHQLKVAKKNRLDPSANLATVYQTNEEASYALKGFVESSPTKEILAAAPNAKFHFEAFVRHKHAGLTDVVALQYICETPTAGKTRFWIGVQREYSNFTGRGDWQIIDITIARPRAG